MRRPPALVRRLYTGAVLLLLVGAAALVAAQTRALAPTAGPAAGRVHGALGARLDAYLAERARVGFSGVVLVARGDTVLLHKGYGLAERARRVPLRPSAVFDIGSITKQFTAAGVLLLQHEGKLRVADSLGRFFPDAPADKRGITLHQLLTHTAGLPLYSGGDYELVSRDTMLARVWAAPLAARPGERFEYSNPGFGVLAAVIERVAGVPWERFVRERLLIPADMRETGYVAQRVGRATLAHGYRGGAGWGTPLDHAWLPDGPSWNLRGNGGLLSTAEDLYRWDRALSRGRVLPAGVAASMCAPRARAPRWEYGYGCTVHRGAGGRRVVGHSGGNGYFAAWLERYPDDDAVVVVLANDTRPGIGQVRGRVAEILFAGGR